jgi:hypothetical protein
MAALPEVRCEGKKMKTSECRSCGAEIVWIKTELGKWMPVDADTITEGDEVFDPGEHVSHFSTCPDAGAHRRPR